MSKTNSQTRTVDPVFWIFLVWALLLLATGVWLLVDRQLLACMVVSAASAWLFRLGGLAARGDL